MQPRMASVTLVALASFLACGDRNEGSHVAARTDSPGEGCEGSLGCLRLQQVRLIGDADGPGMIEGEAGTVRLDSRGRYYVYREFGQEIKVFSPDGDYLRTIGRQGAGPGEFQGISFIHFGADDSLHVVDPLNMRWNVFSPEYEHVRSSQLNVPVYMQMHLLPDGSGLFSAPVRGELARFPLHLVSATGEHVRSFGAAPDGFEQIGSDAAWRRIAPAGPTSVWAAYHDRYRIELWDAAEESGATLRVVERTVDWFPPGLQEEISMEAPPTPRMRAIRQDSAGRLLVLLSVADPRWREAVEPGPVHNNVSERHLYNDTRIEMLDAASGELLASAVHDTVFHKFIADDLVIASVVDETGAPRVAVWRISLAGER